MDNALGFGIPSNPVLTLAGAINVVAYDENFNWVTTQSLSNISITGNVVTNSVATGIRMENVNSGRLSGNTVLNYALQPTDYVWYLAAGETITQIETDLKQPVLVVNSTGVTNANNTTTGTWVANVANADGSYRLAPGSIASAYGTNLATATLQAGVQPLPDSLAGVTVTVTDSAGVSRPAGIYYVSPSLVSYVVPAGTAPGVATVTIGKQSSAALVSSVGPAIYAANGTGKGVAAATAVRVSANGTQVQVPVFQCGSTGCTSVPMSLGSATDSLVVALYGTGIRGRSLLSNVVAEIGGVPGTIAYAGSETVYDGLDQVNVYVPTSLAGAGEVPIVLTVDGITANVVTINIQ
ncbi:MAG: hypothetical protein ABSB35_30340 [Bryobacteraceae bacterium]